MTAPAWEAIEGARPGIAVVHPLNDLVEHDIDGEDACVCGPAVEPIERHDGSYGWVYTHQALDGRK